MITVALELKFILYRPRSLLAVVIVLQNIVQGKINLKGYDHSDVH